MGLSRSTRILILLGIDTAFFFLEIVVGYAVHSLALVADSFHMLNDVFSLLVALWAIRLAKAKSSSDYTYGWQRAEVLGALVNGVFLLALCLSIFLEAIQRFFEPQNIKNPWLVLGVGSAGLASNIVGLFLFHDHGHSHGEHGHEHAGHSHDEEAIPPIDIGVNRDGEEFRSETGAIEPVLPGSYVRRVASASPAPNAGRARSNTEHSRKQHFASPVRDIYVHPALNRQEVLRAAASEGSDSAISSDGEEETNENTPLFNSGKAAAYNGHKHNASTSTARSRRDSRNWHNSHHHSQPKRTTSSHGHSHENLNMRGVFLHVMGDALGNVGVIATAILLIVFPDSHVALYADPAISLLITVIIFSSALPLVKSASKILLQGVPKGISLEEVKQDISRLPGVESVHELHIWQLSDVKLIASLHIQLSFHPEEDKGGKYMKLAKHIRKCLHAVGIHSATIQPEYEVPQGGSECLLMCGDECVRSKCCDPNGYQPQPPAEATHHEHLH